MGAVGAVLGPHGVILAILYTTLVGGLYALLVILKNKFFFNLAFWLKCLLEKTRITSKLSMFIRPDGAVQTKLCYGIAIALGTFIYMGLQISGTPQLITF